MTYVEQQTSAELRAHMRSLKKMYGWHEPLADRLFREVEAQDAEIENLRAQVAALEAARDAYDRGPRAHIKTGKETGNAGLGERQL